MLILACCRKIFSCLFLICYIFSDWNKENLLTSQQQKVDWDNICVYVSTCQADLKKNFQCLHGKDGQTAKIVDQLFNSFSNLPHHSCPIGCHIIHKRNLSKKHFKRTFSKRKNFNRTKISRNNLKWPYTTSTEMCKMSFIDTKCQPF